MWIVAAIALVAIGGAVSAYGQYEQGQSQKKMANYQADVAGQQQMLAQRTAEENSRLNQTAAMYDTQQEQRKYAVLAGAQKASRAASGLGAGSETEGDIATDTFKTQSLDEQMIRYNADLKSWDLNRNAGMEVWGLGTQINQYRAAGSSAARAGSIGATSTILKTAGSVAMMGYSAYGGGTTTKAPTAPGGGRD